MASFWVTMRIYEKYIPPVIKETRRTQNNTSMPVSQKYILAYQQLVLCTKLVGVCTVLFESFRNDLENFELAHTSELIRFKSPADRDSQTKLSSHRFKLELLRWCGVDIKVSHYPSTRCPVYSFDWVWLGYHFLAERAEVHCESAAEAVVMTCVGRKKNIHHKSHTNLFNSVDVE